MDKNEIILGAGELYLMLFNGTELPEESVIEAEKNNVGHCQGGFKIDYKPTKYDVINQYEKIVRSFITKEEISAQTGILSWDLNKLAMLSTAEHTIDAEKKVKKLLFTGKGKSLPTCCFGLYIQKKTERKFALP